MTFFFFSCKEIKNTEEIKNDNYYDIVVNEDIEDVTAEFKVIIDAVVLKNDKFQLYYNNSENNKFSSNGMSECLIRGNTLSQKIIFTIDSDVLPKNLRIDFGINFNQKPIILNTVAIRYENKEFNFDRDKFIQLFKGNRFTSFNPETGKMTNIEINKSYDPFYTSIDLEEIFYELMIR